MNNAVKYRVIQITIANLAKNIDKVVTTLLKMYAIENLSAEFLQNKCCCLCYHLSQNFTI